MSTESLHKFVVALQTFLVERTYAQQTQERIEALELEGLSFSPAELEVPDERI